MKFVVNLAFWEMLKKQHSPLTEKVQPTVDFVEQTFDVRLFDDDKETLNKATDMLCMINKMGEDGKKHERKQEVLSTMVTIVVILVLVKYCKISSIVASLVVGSQLPPPVLTTLQLPGPVENMYITCQTLVTGF